MQTTTNTYKPGTMIEYKDDDGFGLRLARVVSDLGSGWLAVHIAGTSDDIFDEEFDEPHIRAEIVERVVSEPEFQAITAGVAEPDSLIRECPDCHGTGEYREEECEECGGAGTIELAYKAGDIVEYGEGAPVRIGTVIRLVNQWTAEIHPADRAGAADIWVSSKSIKRIVEWGDFWAQRDGAAPDPLSNLTVEEKLVASIAVANYRAQRARNAA